MVLTEPLFFPGGNNTSELEGLEGGLEAGSRGSSGSPSFKNICLRSGVHVFTIK